MVKTLRFNDVIRNSDGKKIQGIKFSTEQNEEPMDVDSIATMFKDVVKGLKDTGFEGKIQLTVKDPETGQYKTVFKFTDVNIITDFFIDDELVDYWGKLAARIGGNPLGEYKEFYVKMMSDPETEEEFGKDKYNDCFYNCLIKLAEKETKEVFPTPESLKSFLGISRIAKTKMEHIPLVEEKLKGIKLRVLGDDTYLSVKPALKEITLELSDSHLSVYEPDLNFCSGVSEQEKPIAVYKYDKDNKVVHLYNGKNHFNISVEKFKDWKKKMRHNGKSSSKYMLIPCKNNNLEKTFNDFMIDASFLEYLTDGKYDLFCSGYIKNCVLARFYELNKTLKADMIEQDEAEWLSSCFMNGLIWAKKGYRGKGHKADIVSCYSSIMRQQKFCFPIKRGTFKQLTNGEFQELKYFAYGIYRVQIKKFDPKLLRIKGEYATHFDLTRAKELGYEIKLIQDNKPNFLDYSGANMKADGRVFQQLVDELFILKKKYCKGSDKEFPLFKELLNILWGALCQRRTMQAFVSKKGEYQLKKNEILEEIKDMGNYVIPKFSTKNKQFVTPFARLGPFLLARARCLMSHLIEKHYDDVVRVYVDGIITTKKIVIEKVDNRKLENLGMGDDIGCLKYEGYHPSINILNASHIVNDDGKRCLDEFKI